MAEVIQTVGPLAGICGHDGTNWEKVLIDASKRLVVAIDAFSAAVEITQDTPGDLLTGVHHYDGTTWRKASLGWGYYDRWSERLVDLNATAGNNTLASTAVPAGYVYVLQAASSQNNTTNPTDIMIYCTDGTNNPKLVYTAAPGVSVPVVWVGEAALKEGDQVKALIRGCVAGDDIYLEIWGYMMKINM